MAAARASTAKSRRTSNSKRSKRSKQSKRTYTSSYYEIMESAVRSVSYYRKHSDRFVMDYLHWDLHLFQRMLILIMNICTVFVFIGCRGIGKTFISAIYSVERAVLYPGSKICIACKVRSQGMNVLEKIMLELKPRSPELALEIDEKQTKINGAMAQIVFKNGSYIKVVTASDSARGNRANILLLDEFRMIPKDVIDMVLRKFLTLPRQPKYSELTKEERKKEYAKEKNKTLYLSSAYFVDHWSYLKCLDTCRAMLGEKKQFICGLPYQLSIKEGLLDAETVADEMAESDFSQLKFDMEYSALWYGDNDGAFFDYKSISKNRNIKYPMLPGSLSVKLNHPERLRILPKEPGEIRILSVDIALMSSKKNKNDATAVFINCMKPPRKQSRSGRYMSNIVYTDSYEGLRTDDQALRIRRLFDEYSCDYMVLDAQGVGMGVYDAVSRDMVDPESGETYDALSCCNDAEMASRCTVPDAPKVVWSVKASAKMNSDCAYLLREAFRSGRIRLLMTEYDGEDLLSEIRGYNTLTPSERLSLQMPYIQTTLLIDEMTKLNHEENNGKVKVYERSGMRKDRYSSLAYNYYVAVQLENKMRKKRNLDYNPDDSFIIRPPGGRTVLKGRTRRMVKGW